MNRRLPLGVLGLLLVLPGLAAAQAFTSGSTGADGPFNPTCTPTPCTVIVTLPASGVFNFTTITVPSNVTVQFTRNVANTPVTVLATGSVLINGTLDVSGNPAAAWGRPGQGGPGGFDGGVGADGVTTTRAGNGLGPGGGTGGLGTAGGGGGGFSTPGTGGSLWQSGGGATPGTGGASYGGPALRPPLGGSGGGGGGTTLGTATGEGGGGGGALLLASSTSITLNSYPAIRANGGDGGGGRGGAGSGGAIRLIAPAITGAGWLHAQGGAGGGYGGAGGVGRIRLEATTLSYTGTTTPLATAALPQPVYPPAGQPSLAITSVGGIAAPATPTGSFLASPDIVLPTGTTNPVEVVLTASHIPPGTAILVTATPQSGTPTTATSTGLSGTLDSATATASLTISLSQVNVLTATATFPLVASAGDGPIYADGQEVTHVKVAAVLGGSSQITYLTRSGREVAVW